MMRKLTQNLAILCGLSICCAVPAIAENLTPPNPQVEAAAAKALLKVRKQLNKSNLAASKSSPRINHYGWDLRFIAVSLAKLGHMEDALKTSQAIPFKDHKIITRDEVRRLTARRAARFGDTHKALAIIPNMTNSRVRIDALFAVAREFLRKKEPKAARKVLLRARPLIEQKGLLHSHSFAKNNLRILIYAAYLFAKSDDDRTAKVLFAEAKTLVKPPTQKANESKDDRKYAAFEYRSKQNMYSRFLLKAGFVDDWVEFNKGRDKVYRARDFRQLIELDHLDTALKIAREAHPDHPLSQAKALTDIATILSDKRPSKSLSLLQEAKSKLTKPLVLNDKNDNTKQRVATSTLFYMAYAYRRLGHKKDAKECLSKSIKELPLKLQAVTEMTYYLIPLQGSLFSTNLTYNKSSVSKAKAIGEYYLPKLKDRDMKFNILRILTTAQISVGQTKMAKANIAIMESIAKKKMASATNPNDFNNIFNVAKFWKQVGEDAHCDQILEEIYNAPLYDENHTRLDRAHQIIRANFIDEGLRFVESIPLDQRKTKVTYQGGLARSWVQKYPDKFPWPLLKNKDLSTRIDLLYNYVKALTRDIYKSDGEATLTLTSNGAGMSYT